MCAVFGVLDYKGNLEAVQRLRLVKALGTAAEVRGTDATGIAFFQRNRLCIQKAAKPAHKMKYRIPSEVRYIMGHTRMTTQGNANENQNNHPFPVWQNNMCKHYSAENRYRIKKCLNLLEYKSFQHNICMRSTKCEYRYYAGKC